MAADAIQVLSATVMDLALESAATTAFVQPLEGATVIALGVAATAYTVNRAASVTGMVATLYQYDNGLNGVAQTDAFVSVGSAVLGSIPMISQEIGIANLMYDALPLFKPE